MRTIARFMDARNTAEGKFLSVLLSVLLVFSFLNVTMFTDYANATDGTAPEVAVEENQSLDAVDPAAEESEEEAEEGDGAPEQEQSESEEPVGEVTEAENNSEEANSVAVEGPAPSKETNGKDLEGSSFTSAAFSLNQLSLEEEQSLDESGIAPQVASGGVVRVNEVAKLTGTSGGRNHNWTSSNTSIATVKADGATAEVIGKSAGEVTITHTWAANSWSYTRQETFTLRVEGSDIPEGSTRVYVYFKTEATGWAANGNGWYTVGYIDVPGLVKPSETMSQKQLSAAHATVEKYIKAHPEEVVRHSDNSGLAVNFNAVQWSGKVNNNSFGLKVASGDLGGAAGYEADNVCYHFDGYLPVVTTCNVKVTYSYHEGEEGTTPLKDDVDQDVQMGASFNTDIPAVDGYVAVCSDKQFTGKDSIVYDNVATDVEVAVVYHKDSNGNNVPDCQEEKYTVRYEPGIIENAFDAEDYTFTGLLPDFDTPAAPVVGDTDAYRFTGWSPSRSEKVTGNVTYVAQWRRLSISLLHIKMDVTERSSLTS